MGEIRIFILFIVCLFTVWVAPCFGDVLFSYGYSPQGIAMGGAFSALVDDFSAAYYNPAASIWLKRPNVGLGYTVTGNDLWMKPGDVPELDRTQGLIFGTTLPFPLGGFMRHRIAFGFSCFFPDGVILDIQVPYPTQPQWVNLQNSGRSLTLIPTMAVRIINGLSIGGGAQLFDNTSGQLSATVDPNGRIEATVGQELTTSASPVAGIHFAPGMIWPDAAGWRFGVVYREKFFTRYKIPVNTYIGPVPLNVTFEAISLFTPRQIVIGGGWRNRRVSAEMDATYNFWSEMPDPNLDIEVNFEIPLLPVDFASSERFAPEFRDTLTPRAGLEVRPLANDNFDLGLRFGYFYDPSPVPKQDGRTNYLDTNRHVFAPGLGFDLRRIKGEELPSTIELDAVFQCQYLQPRTFFKQSGTETDNPGYPSLEFGGYLWAVSFTVSTRFDIN